MRGWEVWCGPITIKSAPWPLATFKMCSAGAPTSTMNSLSSERPASDGRSCRSRFIAMSLSASGYSSGTSAGIVRICSKVKWACSCSDNQSAYARDFAEPGSKSVAYRILASFSSGSRGGVWPGRKHGAGRGINDLLCYRTKQNLLHAASSMRSQDDQINFQLLHQFGQNLGNSSLSLCDQFLMLDRLEQTRTSQGSPFCSRQNV